MTTNKNSKNLLICNSNFFGEHKLNSFKIKNFNILKKNFTSSNKLYDYLKNSKKKIHAIFISLETPLSKQHFDLMDDLKHVFTPTTGINHIKNKPKFIKIFNLNTRDKIIKNITSTPELIIGLIIAYFRNLFQAYNGVKKNNWQRNFYIGNSLNNKTIGIIGYGRIGKRLANYSETLGMKVLIYDEKKIRKNHKKHVTLKKLLSKSDVVSLNINYKDKFDKFFNYSIFQLMKKNSLFVNTSRGELISEKCLIKALNKKIISGAILDVLYDQQIGKKIKNKEILKYINNNENLIITPHIGGATYEAFNIVKDYILNMSKRILENE